MSRLIEIKYEDKSGCEVLKNKVEVVKDGGIKNSYKKGREVFDCVVYFKDEINPKGLCSKRFKHNLLFDEAVDLREGQTFKIGGLDFLVLRNKDCFAECELVVGKSHCPLRKAVFIRALENGVISIGDEIKK
ncbi:hypothetical protein PL321_00820 [Caloramator sp. mosi_1]|uniref:hypothetical protein n=1 Tax=Caloramator sp. mosi_1 TaxID=3023090 RepID=UPI00235E3D15|nr:hypothetical protein [Caloramator sp. mosi_1]WDC84400.1 hypothetical protein PL321_00820 [Caloramator sp. mosi_1]